MENLKTEILYNGNPVVLNKNIQKFILGKEIIDIKFSASENTCFALIIYK